MKRKLLIVDTNALFHRSRSALLRSAGEMTTSYGAPVTGTYGVLNALFSILEKHEIDCVVPVFDAGGNWRKKESDAYKADRETTTPAHKADMGILIEEVFPALGFNPIGIKGVEADDVIATISRNSPAFEEIFVLSCDKDLLQLVTNRVKVILFNSAKKIKVVDIDGVIETFGVFPSEVKYFKALAGDPSDNVAGLKGVGPKTAVKIIHECRPTEVNPEFTGADRIVLHPKVRDHANNFLGNLRLVTLENNVPEVKWFASTPPPQGSVRSAFVQLEFNSFLKPARFAKVLRALGTEPVPV